MDVKKSPFATKNIKPILYYDDLNADSRASLMLLKMLNVDAELRLVNLVKGEHLTNSYKDINPASIVPTLVHNDVVLTGHSILLYVCENLSKAYSKQLLATDCYKKQLRILNRLFFESRILHRRHGDLMTDLVLKKFGNVNVDYHRKRIEAAYDTLESYLQNNEFMAGNMMTLADIAIISTVGALDLMFSLEEKQERWGKLQDWFRRMCAIPVYNIIFDGIEKQREIVEHYAQFTFPSPTKRLSQLAHASPAPRLTLHPEECQCISNNFAKPAPMGEYGQDRSVLYTSTVQNAAYQSQGSAQLSRQRDGSLSRQQTDENSNEYGGQKLQIKGLPACCCEPDGRINKRQEEKKPQTPVQGTSNISSGQLGQNDGISPCSCEQEQFKNMWTEEPYTCGDQFVQIDGLSSCVCSPEPTNTKLQIPTENMQGQVAQTGDIAAHCSCDPGEGNSRWQDDAQPQMSMNERPVIPADQWAQTERGEVCCCEQDKHQENPNVTRSESRHQPEHDTSGTSERDIAARYVEDGKNDHGRLSTTERTVSINPKQVNIFQAEGNTFGELNITKVEGKDGEANIRLCLTVSSGAVPQKIYQAETSNSVATQPSRSSKSDSRMLSPLTSKDSSKKNVVSKKAIENSNREPSGKVRKGANNNNIVRRSGGGIKLIDVTNDLDHTPTTTAGPAITIVFPKYPNINEGMDDVKCMPGRTEIKLLNIATYNESAFSVISENTNKNGTVSSVEEKTKSGKTVGKYKKKAQKARTRSVKDTTVSGVTATTVGTSTAGVATVAQIATKVMHKIRYGDESGASVQVLYKNEQSVSRSEQKVTCDTSSVSSITTTPSTATMILVSKESKSNYNNNGNRNESESVGATGFISHIGRTHDEIRRTYPTALRSQIEQSTKLCRNATKRKAK